MTDLLACLHRGRPLFDGSTVRYLGFTGGSADSFILLFSVRPPEMPNHLKPVWSLGMINMSGEIASWLIERPGCSWESAGGFRRPTLFELGLYKRDDLFVFESRT